MADVVRRLLYAEEAAELVGVQVSTIRQWVHRGHLEPYGMEGKRHLYLDASVYAAERATRRRRRGA